MSTKKAPKRPETAGSPDQGEALLSRSVDMLRPLVDLLISQGVGYPSLSRALRTAFVQAAREQLGREGGQLTDAAVSLRSGVHRKEVKTVNEALGEATNPGGSSDHGTVNIGSIPERSLSIAEQVYTRWTTDATYHDAQSRPAGLAISGDAPSFESLVTSVTRDFSRRTVLDELLRLGMVEVLETNVRPLAPAMVPPQAWDELTQYFSDHLHDHLAAGAANLHAARTGDKPPFLEHSMYANGLSDLSIEQLSMLARDVWKPAFNQMVGAARQRYDLDSQDNRQGRLRFGVYLYSEPDSDSAPTALSSKTSGKPAKTAKKPKKTTKKKAKKSSQKKPATSANKRSRK